MSASSLRWTRMLSLGTRPGDARPFDDAAAACHCCANDGCPTPDADPGQHARRDRRHLALAGNAMGHGGHPVHHDDVVQFPQSDHAAVPAGTRRPYRGRHRPLVRHPERLHLLCRRVHLAAVGTARRPLRAQADADPFQLRDRRVHRVHGAVADRVAVLRRPRADGRVRRLLLNRDGPGGEPGARAAVRLRARLAKLRATGRFAGGTGHRRYPRRHHPQLSDSLLLHLRRHIRRGVPGLARRARALRAPAARIAGAPASAAWR